MPNGLRSDWRLESERLSQTTNIVNLPEAMEQHEAKLIRDALSANHGDVRSTLETLGIPRKTFYDKLQRHGIDRADYAKQKPGD